MAMMAESRYWKDLLFELASRLRAPMLQEKMTDDHYGILEHDLLVGFYSVRKLIESETTLTDRTKASTIAVTGYSNKAPVNHLSKDDIYSIYDFDKPDEQSLPIWQISSVFIHSYILIAYQDENGFLHGVFVTSKRHKDRILYKVSLGEICDVFERIGGDYPTDLRWRRQPNGNDRFDVR